jgi:hypothetical protein
MDMEDMGFQQDGATCHTARETIELLRENFRCRVISRNGNVVFARVPIVMALLTPIFVVVGGD